MVDKVRPLKIEDSTSGTQNDMMPTEANPTEDYLSTKGLALEGSDNTLISGDSGVIKFKDSEVTTLKTLKDAMERLQYKDVDLASLNNGYVLTWNNSSTKFELQPAGGSGGGSGVTPPFSFSKSGNAAAGTYLRVGEAVTSNTGMPIVGTNTIVKLYVSNGTAVASNTVIQIQKRTGVSTFTDISGASITITTGNYKASSTGLSISLSTDEEISAYVKSGSTLSNPIFNVYLVPS